jgi:hypothetical protein
VIVQGGIRRIIKSVSVALHIHHSNKVFFFFLTEFDCYLFNPVLNRDKHAKVYIWHDNNNEHICLFVYVYICMIPWQEL